MSNFILPLPTPQNTPANVPGAASRPHAPAPEGIGFKEIMAASMAASAGPGTVSLLGMTQEMAAAAQELGAGGQDNGIIQQLRSRILAELSVALGRDLHDARGDPPNSAAPPGQEPGRQPGSLDRIAGGAKPVDEKGQAGNKSGTGRIATAFAEMLQAGTASDAPEAPQVQPLPNSQQAGESGRIQYAQVAAYRLAAGLQDEIGAQGRPGATPAAEAGGPARQTEADSAPASFNSASAVQMQARNALAAGRPTFENQPVLNAARIMVPRPAADAPVSQPVPAAAMEPELNIQSNQLAVANAVRSEVGAGTPAPALGAEPMPVDAGQRTLLQGGQAVRQAARQGLEGNQTDSGFAPGVSAGRFGFDASSVPAGPAAVQAALAQVVQEATAMPAREVRDLTLELDTAGLGKITVRMSMREAEGLVIEMRAGSELAARALRAELPQLAQMLERHNLSAGTQLNVTSSSGFENNPNQARHQAWWFEHAGSGPAVESQEAGTPGSATRFHVRWNWAVDLLA